MTIDEVKKALENHLYSQLVFNSPILSGNMMMNISQGSSEIIIAAPFYDNKMWRKKHIIVHTGETKNGLTDYANSVNEVGGFGTHNKSEHWVNRVVNTCCRDIAGLYNGKVEGELEE